MNNYSYISIQNIPYYNATNDSSFGTTSTPVKAKATPMRIRVLPPELEAQLNSNLVDLIQAIQKQGDCFGGHDNNLRWWQEENPDVAAATYRLLTKVRIIEAKQFIVTAFESFKAVERWEER